MGPSDSSEKYFKKTFAKHLEVVGKGVYICAPNDKGYVIKAYRISLGERYLT